MAMVIDTSALLAVVLGEPERPKLIAATEGESLTAPAVLPYEVGNAISAMSKRGRIAPNECLEIWGSFESIPIQLRQIDIAAAIMLADELGIYAYDAYFLQLCLAAKLPLLTLDSAMNRHAAKLGINRWSL
ncbi:MAG: PIN domain-containing protein [Candidatus Hydrogenedens sp.]|nr:PIN domain-containing protein [Candidatus Hydrogenedens sp.]